MSEKLKPCPFCGGEVETIEQDDGSWAVECYFDRCYITVHFGVREQRSESGIIKAWNKRTEAENENKTTD